jgi:phosphohistidine phosphatase
MLLYLLRHGDALDDPTLHDSERPLSDLGVQQASAAAEFLKRSCASIHVIMTSPLLRARQMADPAKVLLKVGEILISDYLTPGSDQRQLFSLINTKNAESILLVGHEPHLSRTIAFLLFGESGARIEMKKASCACVETPLPIERGRGVLKWLATADQMMRGQ